MTRRPARRSRFGRLLRLTGERAATGDRLTIAERVRFGLDRATRERII